MRALADLGLDQNALKSGAVPAQDLSIHSGFGAFMALISAKIWADDAFSRSRSFAICAALAILPFILISAHSKAAPILLMACILIIPSAAGLAFANTAGSYRALQVQFLAIFVLAACGLSSDLGSGVALTLFILSLVDFFIFAPKQAFKSRLVRSSAASALVFFGVFASYSGNFQNSTTFGAGTFGAGFLAIIPLLVQVTFGLYKLRFYEHAQKHSAQPHNSIDNLALEASDELALIIDQSGRIASAGANVARILGTSGDTLLGRGLFERLHPVDRPAFLMACSQMSQPVADLPLRLTTGSTENSTLPLNYALFTVRMIPVSEKEPKTSLMMLREVVAQHSVDMRFQPLKDQHKPTIHKPTTHNPTIHKPTTHNPTAHEHKSEEDAITRARLLSEISHDVRTPLNAIMGFSELLSDLARQPKSPGSIAEYGQIIHRSSQDLLEVVTHLIDLTRLENGVFKMVPETLAPKEVLDQLGDILSQKLDTSSLDLSLSGALHNVDWTVDKRSARQILTTIAVVLLNKTQSLALKIDVSVINSTLCFSLSCPKNMSSSWQSKPIIGLHMSLEITRILARLMGGMAEIKLSESGRQIAEVHFPLECSLHNQGGTDLVQLSKFRDSKRKSSSSSASNTLVKKHA